MITVEDGISYLPKSAKDLKSQAYNAAAKGIVDVIKKKVNQIDSEGKSARIIITGKVSKYGLPFEAEMLVTQCDDADLLQRIQQELGISGM